MEDHREAGVQDFLHLMKDYLDGKIEIRSYQQGIFTLMKRRARFTDEEFRMLQMAFDDADDYDPVVKLEYTILEPEIRRRVACCIQALAVLGYDEDRVDSNPFRS